MADLKTNEERRAAGRARRGDVPRSSHAGWVAPADRPDPVTLLEARHRTRLPDLVPIRVGRMLVSPFTFLRGAAEVMANDLATTPTTGFRVQACGDAHLLNFGVFATPERHLVFDVNDFDETLPGPWEWDVKRLAASIEIAARSVTLAPGTPGQAVQGMVWAYRQRMGQLAAMSPLDVWYERIDVDAVLALARKRKTSSARTVERLIAHARQHTSLAALPKLTELVDGRRRIVEDPPLILHAQHELDVPRKVIEACLESMSPERRVLLDRYRVVDAARKVVGVGSVGTRCHVALLMDHDDGAPLFLQVKEAEASVLAPLRRSVRLPAPGRAGRHRATAHAGGERRVPRLGDRALRSRLLRAPAARHEGIGRDRRPHRGRARALRLRCAASPWPVRTRGRATPPPSPGTWAPATSSTGPSSAFADGYADQTVEDHAALQQAVADGRIEAVIDR